MAGMGNVPKRGIKLIAQVQAQPGLVVSAKREGVEVDRYKCSEEDAMVAWFYDPLGGPIETVDHRDQKPDGSYGAALDEEQCIYHFMSRRLGKIVRVRFLRGYSMKPKAVTLYLFDVHQFTHSPGNVPIQLNQFDEPRRRFSPPSGLEISQSEKFGKVYAEWLGSGEFYLNAIPAKTDESHTVRLEVRQNPFAIPLGKGETPSCPQPVDAVKVQCYIYRVQESVQWLTYRNAVIRQVDNNISLVFPTQQEVGKLESVGASIKRSSNNPIPLGKSRSPFTPDLFIELERKTMSDFWLNPRISIADVSPSLDELGLPSLKVRIGWTSVGRDFIGSKAQMPRLGTIPVLKIAVKIRRPILVETKMLTFPVHMGPLPASLLGGPHPSGQVVQKQTFLYSAETIGTTP